MDFCDSSSRYEEIYLNSALDQHKQAVMSSLEKETGFCLYCGEKLDHPGKFCSKECRDDYEHEQKLKQISGRK
jgi:hypothetical protein